MGHMSDDQIREQLVEAIRNLLRSARLAVPEITDETCPLDIEGFDSQTWPYVMSELEELLGIEIPETMNIFVSKSGQGGKPRKLKVREIVDVLLKLRENGGNS